MRRSIRKRWSSFGFASWSGPTKNYFMFLQLRAGGTHLATTRLAIPGWISSGRIGNSVAGRGSFSRPNCFRVSRHGARIRFTTVNPRSLGFHEFRRPKGRVLIKPRPFQGFGVTVEEGLQGALIDPA